MGARHTEWIGNDKSASRLLGPTWPPNGLRSDVAHGASGRIGNPEVIHMSGLPFLWSEFGEDAGRNPCGRVKNGP
jgi:hypothetical protein